MTPVRLAAVPVRRGNDASLVEVEMLMIRIQHVSDNATRAQLVDDRYVLERRSKPCRVCQVGYGRCVGLLLVAGGLSPALPVNDYVAAHKMIDKRKIGMSDEMHVVRYWRKRVF